jgi:hypothetical protein
MKTRAIQFDAFDGGPPAGESDQHSIGRRRIGRTKREPSGRRFLSLRLFSSAASTSAFLSAWGFAFASAGFFLIGASAFATGGAFCGAGRFFCIHHIIVKFVITTADESSMKVMKRLSMRFDQISSAMNSRIGIVHLEASVDNAEPTVCRGGYGDVPPR